MQKKKTHQQQNSNWYIALGLGPERNRGEKRHPDYKNGSKGHPDYVRSGAKGHPDAIGAGHFPLFCPGFCKKKISGCPD